MGSGKTSVGQELATRLGRELVDTDDLVETTVGTPIADIFERIGEAAFREIEAQTVRDAAARERVVVATGGGVVLRADNMVALRATGVVVLLATTPEAVYERVADETHRPLLKVANPVARIADMMRDRADAYAQADCRVETAGRSVSDVAGGVLDAVRAHITTHEEACEPPN
jgi:shikimate kinase